MLKLLFVVAVLALATYATIRLIQSNRADPSVRSLPFTSPPFKLPTRRRPPPQRPMGPDDDEDFLRDLDRRRRHPDEPDA